jgi:hypothetical protein
MKPTGHEERYQGLVEAMQKRLVNRKKPRGLAGAITNIVPPRLIAGR